MTSTRIKRRSLLGLAGTTLVVLLLFAARSGAAPASAHADPAVNMDTDPAGNTALSLGPLQSCVVVETGQQFSLDITVDAVQDPDQLAGFDATVAYDSSALRVVGVDNVEFLTGGAPSDNFVDFTDRVPDSDGSFNIAAFNLVLNGATGSGVLSRVTFETIRPGVTSLAFNEAGLYEPNGDQIAIGNLNEAIVSVSGPPCDQLTPPAPRPAPTPAPTPEPTPPTTPGPSTTPTPRPTPAPFSIVHIAADSAVVAPGQVFTVDVAMDGPPGAIGAFNIRLGFDPAALRPVSCGPEIDLFACNAVFDDHTMAFDGISLHGFAVHVVVATATFVATAAPSSSVLDVRIEEIYDVNTIDMIAYTAVTPGQVTIQAAPASATPTATPYKLPHPPTPTVRPTPSARPPRAGTPTALPTGSPGPRHSYMEESAPASSSEQALSQRSNAAPSLTEARIAELSQVVGGPQADGGASGNTVTEMQESSGPGRSLAVTLLVAAGAALAVIAGCILVVRRLPDR